MSEQDGPAAGRARFSARDRALLDFERDWRAWQGGKEAAIRRLFGISAARYYQLLSRLIDLPAAQEYDPLLVARLRRRRAERISHKVARPVDHRRR